MTNAAQQVPVDADESTPRWPGAASRFALFAEVLWVGVLVSVVSIALLTAPAALAAGSAHLRRFLAGETSSVGAFFRDVKAALPGGLPVAAATGILLMLLLVNVSIAQTGALPAAEFMLAISAVLIVAVLVALLLIAGSWTAASGWMASVRGLPARIRADLPGVVLVAVAVLLTGVVAWQLPPLVVPGIGCLVFALVAVSERHRGN